MYAIRSYYGSAIVDAPSTMVVDGTQLKVYAWYDNEMGSNIKQCKRCKQLFHSNGLSYCPECVVVV